MLHQIQRILEEAGLKLIASFRYSAPLEDLRLKPSAR
jgi:hypothetical protein